MRGSKLPCTCLHEMLRPRQTQPNKVSKVPCIRAILTSRDSIALKRKFRQGCSSGTRNFLSRPTLLGPSSSAASWAPSTSRCSLTNETATVGVQVHTLAAKCYPWTSALVYWSRQDSQKHLIAYRFRHERREVVACNLPSKVRNYAYLEIC